jgi:hypothetical protein
LTGTLLHGRTATELGSTGASVCRILDTTLSVPSIELENRLVRMFTSSDG